MVDQHSLDPSTVEGSSIDRSAIDRNPIDRSAIDCNPIDSNSVDPSSGLASSIDSSPVQTNSPSHPGQPMALNPSLQVNLWAHKPWWCQPWSILLTGVVAIAGSWFVLGRLWITLPCAALVLLWWWLFLVLVPAAYRAEASAAAEEPLH